MNNKINMANKKAGFSLVELSVVVAIIALITAGIVAGSEVIESSKRTAVVAMLNKYRSAYDQFLERYYLPPGDLNDAQDIWGATVTANGDGDGLIDLDEDDDLGTVVRGDFLAWHHLGLSGYINGTYQGDTGSASTTIVADDHVPAGPFSGSVFNIMNSSDVAAITFPNIATNTNALIYGNLNGTTNVLAALSTEQSLSIDTKIDNINPSTGQLMSNEIDAATDGSCVNNNSTATDYSDDTYEVSNNGANCVLLFYLESIN